jgi:aminoglycoside phosphotransferase
MPRPPDDVVDLVGDPRNWEPADATDGREPQSWASGDSFVAIRGPGRAAAEAERLAWLAGTVPVPVVQLVSEGTEVDWIVTQRLIGHPANRVDLHGDVTGITVTVARALRALHDTVVDRESFPFPMGWEPLAEEIGRSVPRLEPRSLPDPYARYSAAQLEEFWIAGRPATEDVVLCHGSARLDNLIVDPDVVGWVDVGRLRLADRHLDLAIAQRSVHRNFGPDAVFAFYEAYDVDPDLVRLDHYLLAGHLLNDGLVA